MLCDAGSSPTPYEPQYFIYESKSERVSLSVMSNSEILWTAACQPPLSIAFFRQEYWSGLPFSSPGDLPNPGIEPGSPALWQVDSLPSEPQKMANLWSPKGKGFFTTSATWEAQVH